MSRNPCVYILANKSNSVIYTGVTSNLVKRVYEHKEHLVEGFTATYNVDRLVYFEVCTEMSAAIEREKQIKGWRRSKKMSLVSSMNPDWKDLYSEIV